MNATERARRSDSLYYDTTTTNRRALCDMIANLESDLEESKARNTKTFETGLRWMSKAARFESENAKLRELASLVSEYISHDRCEGCVVKTACNNHKLDECWMTTKLRNQLHELGVYDDEEAKAVL